VGKDQIFHLTIYQSQLKSTFMLIGYHQKNHLINGYFLPALKGQKMIARGFNPWTVFPGFPDPERVKDVCFAFCKKQTIHL